jgi:hypothetical protein
MKLAAAQLKEFDEQGYLFFPNCFSEEEIALLRNDAEAILKLDRQEVWREKSGAPRTDVPLAGLPSAPGRAAAAIIRRGCLRASVQAQRQGRPLKATSGSGTRTTAPGRVTTACRSRAP